MVLELRLADNRDLEASLLAGPGPEKWTNGRKGKEGLMLPLLEGGILSF